jgi:dihydroorotase
VTVLITGALLYGEGEPTDVRVRDGEIVELGTGLAVRDGEEVLVATGLVLLPGFVDLHTHLREPGREDTETIATGSAAAALGGYTAVFAMANTDPVADSVVVVEHVHRRGLEAGLVDVHPVGAVTVGLRGEQLAEMGAMAASAAGVRVFSDDGHCVADPLLMRRALEYATALDVVVAQHAEEPRLTVGAEAHEGPTAARLGLTGWPRTAEEAVVARDVLLVSRGSSACCWPGTPARGCTCATCPPRVPRRSCAGRAPPCRACGSAPRSPRTTCSWTTPGCTPTTR